MSTALALLQREDPVLQGTPTPPLWAALEALGIQPFTDASVARYKEAQIRAHRPPLKERVLWFLCHRLAFMALLGELFVLCFIMAVGCGIYWLITLAVIDVTGMEWAGKMMTLFGLGAAGIIGIGGRLDGRKIRGPVQWRCVPIAQAIDILPLPIARLADRVTQRVPGATFFVDTLVQEERVLDPFLVIRMDGEEYAIAVWDEDFVDPALSA